MNWRIPALGIVLMAGVAVFFLRSTRTEAPDEVAGVVMNVPADALIEEKGALPDTAAARELAALSEAHPDRPRVGISCTLGGREVHYLLDRDQGTIVRQTKSGRTLTEMRWSGDVAARLAYAAEHGTFETPGLMPGIGKNLYH